MRLKTTPVPHHKLPKPDRVYVAADLPLGISALSSAVYYALGVLGGVRPTLPVSLAFFAASYTVSALPPSNGLVEWLNARLYQYPLVVPQGILVALAGAGVEWYFPGGLGPAWGAVCGFAAHFIAVQASYMMNGNRPRSPDQLLA